MRSVRTRRPLGRVVERMSRVWGVVGAEFSARATDMWLLFHGLLRLSWMRLVSEKPTFREGELPSIWEKRL